MVTQHTLTASIGKALQITGRRKEMIIRGGENIYPREIEDFIFTHPKVAEVAVFGVPDDFYGEQVVAWIEPHSGESVSEEEIREFCKENMAHFKIPKYIRFVKEFPMTVTGKLQKFKMREEMSKLIVQGKAIIILQLSLQLHSRPSYIDIRLLA